MQSGWIYLVRMVIFHSKLFKLARDYQTLNVIYNSPKHWQQWGVTRIYHHFFFNGDDLTGTGRSQAVSLRMGHVTNVKWKRRNWVFHWILNTEIYWMTCQSWWCPPFWRRHIMISSASTRLLQPDQFIATRGKQLVVLQFFFGGGGVLEIATLKRTMACSQKAVGSWSQRRPGWRLWSIAGRRCWSTHRFCNVLFIGIES